MTAAMEPQKKRAKLDAAVPAAEAITFHLLKKTPDGDITMDPDSSFPPDMTHQLFGDDEEIRGYDGLSIDIFMTPQFQALVDVKYADKGPKATDLKAPFTNVFDAGFCQSKEELDAALAAEPPLQLAKLGSTVLEAPAPEGARRLVTWARLSEGSPELKALHAHAQALLYFFVDAASAIDASDPQWDIYLALEEAADGTLELLGYCTVYRFYAYPDRVRMRLSQILVLPPNQGRGVGSLLLKALNKQAEAEGTVDVTFEDPSEGLQHIRDKLDLHRMAQCAWLQKDALERVSRVAAAIPAGDGDEDEELEELAAGLVLAPQDLARVQAELRISKQQARRVWEGLLLLLGAGAKQSERVAAAVEAMIARSMLNQVAAAKKDAAGKTVHDVEGGFVMMRTRRRAEQGGGQPADAAAAAAAALAGPPVEGITAEQQQEAIEEAVSARMEELLQVVASMAGGGGAE